VASPALTDAALDRRPRILIDLRSVRIGEHMGEPVPVLGLQAVAKICGVAATTVSNWMSDSKPGRCYAATPFPAPDGHIGKSPWWNPERHDEFTMWMASRPGRGAGGGRKPKPSTTQE